MNVPRFLFSKLAALLLIALPLQAEVAVFNSAADVPISATSYDATGQPLTVTLNFAPTAGTNLTVIRNTGLPFITGEFSNVANGATVNLTYQGTTYPFVAWYYGGNGNDLVLLWRYTGLAAWGRNTNGQLGDGTQVDRNVPVAVKQIGVLAGKTIARVARGQLSTYVLSTEGRVYTLGVEPREVSIEAGVSALAGKTVVMITAGGALCSDGTVALLDGNELPVAVNAESGSALFGRKAVAISAGYDSNNLALCSDGTVVSFLGWPYWTTPVEIDASSASALFGKSVVSITSGLLHYGALCSDGTVVTWGYNFGGSLGDGTNDPGDGNASYKYPPVAVNVQSGISSLFGKSVVSISAGPFHNIALCSDGAIASWGYNGEGALGDLTFTNRNVPVTVYAETEESALFGRTVLNIATGANHSMALCSDGTVAIWGVNSYGSLGDGTNTNSNIPVTVSTASGVSHLHGKAVTALPEAGSFAGHSVVLFGGNPLEIELEVLEPSLSVLTNGVDTVDFGSALPGTVRTFRVRNSSGGVLRGFQASRSGPNASEFIILSQPPTTLAAGASGTFQVAFSPDLSGARNASLHITSDDAAGGAFTVALAATALPPDIDVEVLEPIPQALLDAVGVVDFGVAAPGTLRTIRVTNSGNSTLHNLSVAKSGSDAADFTVLTQPITSLAIGAAATFQVAFSTTVAGTKTAALQIASDDPDENPFDISLSATILPGEIEVDVMEPSITPLADGVSAVDYGSTLHGAVRTFRIRNSGMLPLTGISASLLGANAGAFTVLGQPPESIPPGREAVFQVAFTPASGGAKSAALQIASSDVDEGPFDISLTGTESTSLAVTFNAATDVGVSAYAPTVSGLPLSVALNFAPQPGTNLTVVRNNGPTSMGGEFAGFANGATVNLSYNGATYPFVAWYYGGDGNDFVLLWPYTRLAAWGYNATGQLGDGTTTTRTSPVAVDASSMAGKTIVQAARGGRHTLALTSEGRVYAWGDNSSGQLGDGTTTNRTTPVPVSVDGASKLAGKSVVAVSAGNIFSLALCSDGTVVAWGGNYSLTLGDGTSTSIRLLPVEVNTGSGTSALFGKFVTAICAGGEHSLALCSDGTVVAWGSNSNNQRGTPGGGAYPVAVNASFGASALFGRTVIAIAAGDKQSLAVCSDGTAVAWGGDAIGDGTTSSRQAPVLVSADPSSALFGKVVTSVKAGVGFSVALCSDGTLASWGTNSSGQLGTGTNANRVTPTTVTAVSIATSIETGASHTLALLADGSVSAWGSGTSGQLGGGTTATSPLLSGRRIGSLSRSGMYSFSSAAIFGQQPPELDVEVLEPTIIALSDGGNTVDFGTAYPGTIRTFRVRNNGESELLGLTAALTGIDAGAFTIMAPLPATLVGGASATVRVAFTSAVDGQKTATLQIASNDLDEGVFDVELTGSRVGVLPVALVSSGSPGVVFSDVFAAGGTLDLSLNFAPPSGANLTVIQNTGSSFIRGAFGNIPNGGSVDLSFGGTVYRYIAWYYGGDGNDLVLVWPHTGLTAWGANTSGMVGDGSTTQRNLPVATTQGGVLAGKTIVQIARGSNHTLALSTEGRVYAWGSNGFGQLGDGANVSIRVPMVVDMDSPTSALRGKTVVAVSAGQTFSLALCSDGTVAAWGANTGSQLGDTTTTDRNRPVNVNTASGTSALFGKAVVGISAGTAHSLAACSDGTVAAWGGNANGQLGDRTTIARSSPVAVISSSGALVGKSVTAVAAGGNHSLALCSDGKVVAWGASSAGQLGDNGAGGPPPTAVNTAGVLAGKTVSSIAAGGSFSLALCTDGTLVGWGSNGSGQLGDTTQTSRPLPVAVSTTAGTSALAGRLVTKVSAGTATSSALCSDGTLALWGAGTNGQLGNGGTLSRVSPGQLIPAGTNLVTCLPLSGPVAGTSFAIYSIIPPAFALAAASDIRSTSAVLSGSVNPNGSATIARFEYGTTPAFGTVVSILLSPNNGTAPQNATTALSGLLPGTTYHFRIRAIAGPTTSDSETRTFTTNALPQLQLPASPLVAEAISPAGAAVPFSVTAIDAEDGVLVPTVAPSSGSTFALGDTTVNVSATDSSGETTTGSFVVRVLDTMPPAISHPNELIAATAPGGAQVNFSAATADDAVGVTEITYLPASGAFFAIGTTMVTVTARDAAGNIGMSQFAVRVVPAAPQTVVLGSKGGPVPGAGVSGSGIPAGAVWATFGVPSINDAGQAVVLGTFKVGSASTTAILGWALADPADMVVLAKKGGAAPGLAGAVFSGLKEPLLGVDGAVAWAATLANAPGTTGAVLPTDNAVIFLDPDGAGPAVPAVVVRKGAVVPGAASAAVIPPGVRASPEWGAFTSISLGEQFLAFTATLVRTTPGIAGGPGPGGVTAGTDGGVWVFNRALNTLSASLREGDAANGSTVKVIQSLVARPSSPGHGNGVAGDGDDDYTMIRLTLADMRQGIAKMPVSWFPSLQYIAGGDAPGYGSGARWQRFGLPTQSAGSWATAFVGTVQPSTGTATVANNVGLFIEDDFTHAASLIVSKGDAATGVSGGIFSAFKDPVNARNYAMAFLGTMSTASGITAGSNDGIWFSDATNGMRLVAREGAQPPEAPLGAQWKAFTSLALPEGRGPIFVATMHSKIGTASPGPGGITKADDTGLWATDSFGALRLLIREGDTIGASTVKSFTVLSSVIGSPAQTRSFSKTGSVIVRATDTQGAHHLLHIAVP